MALVYLDRGRSHALVQYGDVQRPTKSSSWFSVWIENHADHIEMYVDAVVSYQLELCDYRMRSVIFICIMLYTARSPRSQLFLCRAPKIR